MIYQLGRGCTVAALCLALGLHWFLLQSVAWTSMVVKYSQSASLSEALAKTFDGEHPCSLCHAVRSGKQTENKTELRPLAQKLDLIAASSSSRVAPPFRTHRYDRVSAALVERPQTPPFLPPRSALS